MGAHADAHDDHHHHRLRPSDWPEDDFMGKASAGKIGMWIFLLSDALMFAGFLLGYGLLRGGAEIWAGTAELAAQGKCLAARCTDLAVSLGASCEAGGRHLEEPMLGINFTAGLTFLLICSSVTMVLAFAECQDGNRKGTVKYLTMTAIGGMFFLAGQYHEYWGFGGHMLIAQGLDFGHSAYATSFYLITSFHGAHVFSGVVYLWITTWRANRGDFDDGYTSEVEICGLFWHFVDLVWILVFTLVYLIPSEHGV